MTTTHSDPLYRDPTPDPSGLPHLRADATTPAGGDAAVTTHDHPDPGASGSDPAETQHAETQYEESLPARVLYRLVDWVQYAVAAVLLVVAAVVLVRSFQAFITDPTGYPQSIVAAIDGVLVVIILLDILRTVLTHFEGSGFPLRPFLIIGVISAIRDILSTSATLTLQRNLTPTDFQRAIIELGVSSAVVLVLLVGLVLMRRTNADCPPAREPRRPAHHQEVPGDLPPSQGSAGP